MHRRTFLLTSLAPLAAAAAGAPAFGAGPRPVRVLAFGDSNTWGLIPTSADEDLRRYSDAERWSGVLQCALGSEFQVCTNGLMVRTFNTDLAKGIGDLSGRDHNGLRRLPLALLVEKPIHLVVVMLGTNDLMARLNRTPEEIAAGAERYAAIVARSTEEHAAIRGPRLLLIAPPLLGDPSHGAFAEDFNHGSVQKSKQLAAALRAGARAAGAAFANAADWIHTDGKDGVHLSAVVHRRLGMAIAAIIRKQLASAQAQQSEAVSVAG